MVAVFKYGNGLNFEGIAINKKDAIIGLYKEHLQELQKRYPDFDYSDEWESKAFEEDAKWWYEGQHVFVIKENVKIF